ncbi:WhiB family transcriptional regulator [Actinomadura sp. KC216]|uniref:WhiB family transcriptional regulator n=1 Tax=Actinomadura sp. KC216 TaxID=2530370 RepID=UPI001404EE2B|nr:WhiB family transcriptional regulator [Actinomadura sp. KC216]
MTVTPLERLNTRTDAPSQAPPAPVSVMDLRGRPVTGAQCWFDPELHTGPDGFESPDERAARELVAAEVCESCPLRGQCLELAMQIRPESGVWAGFTAAELAIDVRPALSDFDLSADCDLSDLDLNEVA